MKITATVQDNGLLERLARAKDDIKRKASQVIRAASFAVEKRIKVEMPVDTGRARASWGHWTPADIVRAGNWTQGDAHWLEKDGGLTVEQGSNVPYIVYLDQGSSTKAPAGFIDKAAEAGARELTTELQQEIGDLL